MAVDVKAIITELVEKISKDDELQKLFKKDPVKAIEKITGLDLPDDLVEKVIDGVKAKLTLDDVAQAASFLKGFLKTPYYAAAHPDVTGKNIPPAAWTGRMFAFQYPTATPSSRIRLVRRRFSIWNLPLHLAQSL